MLAQEAVSETPCVREAALLVAHRWRAAAHPSALGCREPDIHGSVFSAAPACSSAAKMAAERVRPPCALGRSGGLAWLALVSAVRHPALC